MNTINKIDTEVMLTMEELTKAFKDMVESPGDTPTYPDLMEGGEEDESDWDDDPYPLDQYPEGPIPLPTLKRPL